MSVNNSVRVLVANYSEYSIAICFQNMVKYRIHVCRQNTNPAEQRAGDRALTSTCSHHHQRTELQLFLLKSGTTPPPQLPPGGISPLNILSNIALDWDKP